MTSVMPQPDPSPKRQLAVLLPGTGSDDVFVRTVFEGPLAALGVEVVAPRLPRGADVVTGYLGLLDEVADRSDGPVLVGGISLGAHLATEWALRAGRRCAGVLAALPAWHGAPGDAPAAVAARHTADTLSARGLEGALATATAGIAPWLAAELDRAWRRQGAGLEGGLRTAAAHPGPELAELATLDVPVGIAACTDDPVHPVWVARAWAAALPKAALRETTLDAFGADREALGRTAVQAWKVVSGHRG